MATLSPWIDLKEGRGCPLCLPRAQLDARNFFICRLSISSLFLDRNQVYRGTCAVVYDMRHATRPSELTDDEWQAFCSDIRSAESAVSRAFAPDHVNVECLGNTVPHLHAAIVPRYRSDPRWGLPIWTTAREDMARSDATEDECEELARVIRYNLLAIESAGRANA
jgi:diadenosine tetraphosphate (Ap4A) HIT family hydrolase